MGGSIEGSFFYDIGGYMLPFFVNAGCLLLLLPLVFIYVPTNK